MYRISTLALAVVIVALFASCGDASSESSVTSTSGQTSTTTTESVTTTTETTTTIRESTTTIPETTTTTTASVVDVEIVGITAGFDPAVLVVEPGTTVRWTVTDDSIGHTTTSSDGSWDSGVLAPGGQFEIALTDPGTYDYTCSLHPSMRGVVIVDG